MKEITTSPANDLLALLSAQLEKGIDKSGQGESMFESLFQEVIKKDATSPVEGISKDVLVGEGESEEKVPPSLNEGVETTIEAIAPIQDGVMDDPNEGLLPERPVKKEEKENPTVDLLFTHWLLPVQADTKDSKNQSPIQRTFATTIEVKGVVMMQGQEADNAQAEGEGQSSTRTMKNEALLEGMKTSEVAPSASSIKGAEGISATTSSVTSANEPPSINPASTHKDSIQSTIRKEMSFEFSSVFKSVQADKIVIQLKPLELGIVEVTVEQVDGELNVKLKSDNKDVQELLDGMAEELNDEWKQRSVKELDETASESDKEGKTKEESIESEKQYEEEEPNTSFEDMLTEWIGGQSNGWNNRYHQ